MGDVTVHVQALDGAWEVCGADRARGVWPENVRPGSDEWGSKTCGFDLRRDPKAVWPDISAFTPVKVEIGGVLRWKGRVKQTPVRDDLDSVISVQCEGMQAHLDDDLYERVYVHTRVSDWQDIRSSLSADLQYFPQAGQVSGGQGVTLGWQKDDTVVNGTAVGVGLDIGPGSTVRRLVVTYDWNNATSNGNQKLQAFESDVGIGVYGSAISGFEVNPGTGAATGTARGDATKRYVWIQVASQAGGDFTATGELRCRLASIQAFTDAAYETGDASVLTADMIVRDALDRATILLSSDRSGIETGTFNIPEHAMTEPRTPRQVWEATDAFEDRVKKIDLEDRAVYAARPVSPEIEVGAWSAMRFEDASANDGSEVYERVIVKGTKPDGTPLRVERTQAQQPTAIYDPAGAPQLKNPTLASNANDWHVNASGHLTRDTTIVDADAASLRWDKTGANDNFTSFATLQADFDTGTFVAGLPYVARVRMRADATGRDVQALFGATDDYGQFELFGPATGLGTAFATRYITWIPLRSYDASQAGLFFNASAGRYWIDDVKIYTSRPTIVARRNFRRTKVLDISYALTEGSAAKIGDLFLRAHQRTPFKGTVKLTGTGAVREILTGAPLPVDALLDRTGRLVRFSDRIDPDTGHVGRVARIAEVQVDPDTEEATVTLDNSRAGFEALLSRLDIVLGQRA